MLLDGVSPVVLLGLFALYIIVPVAALVLLIWLFVRYRRKRAAQEAENK